jgi:hypothetical protein
VVLPFLGLIPFFISTPLDGHGLISYLDMSRDIYKDDNKLSSFLIVETVWMFSRKEI